MYERRCIEKSYFCLFKDIYQRTSWQQIRQIDRQATRVLTTANQSSGNWSSFSRDSRSRTGGHKRRYESQRKPFRNRFFDETANVVAGMQLKLPHSRNQKSSPLRNSQPLTSINQRNTYVQETALTKSIVYAKTIRGYGALTSRLISGEWQSEGNARVFEQCDYRHWRIEMNIWIIPAPFLSMAANFVM